MMMFWNIPASRLGDVYSRTHHSSPASRTGESSYRRFWKPLRAGGARTETTDAPPSQTPNGQPMKAAHRFPSPLSTDTPHDTPAPRTAVINLSSPTASSAPSIDAKFAKPYPHSWLDASLLPRRTRSVAVQMYGRTACCRPTYPTHVEREPARPAFPFLRICTQRVSRIASGRSAYGGGEG